MSPSRPRGALVHALLSPLQLPRRAWAAAAIYALLGALVLGALLAGFALAEDRLDETLLDFVVPGEQQTGARLFLRFFLAPQTQHVTINALVTLALLFVSLGLFHFKARLARAVETGANLGQPSDWHPPTFWREARSEVALVLVYLALFCVTLALGHSPYPWRRTLASVVSYLVMFLTWAIDFATPILMRRGLGYLQAVKTLARRPLLTLAFGAAMSLPLALMTRALGRLDSPAVPMVAVIFACHLVFILWAAIAGTHVGGAVLRHAARTKPPRRATQLVLAGAVAAVLAVGGWIGGHLAVVLAEKSQLVKCRYEPDWTSLRIDKPSLASLATGKLGVGVALDLQITNPNELAVALERNRLVLATRERELATGFVSPLRVPAGATQREHVRLRMELDVASLAAGIAALDALDLADLRLTLFLDLGDGLEYPVYLRGAR